MFAVPNLLFISNLFPDAAEPYRGLDNATLLHQLRAHFEIRVISPRPALPFARRARRPRAQDEVFAPLYLRTPYVPKAGSRFNHLLMARALRPALRDLRAGFPFDLVLVSWVFPDGCAVARLAGETGFPFVIIAQGSDVHQYLRIPARRAIIARSLPAAAAVITRSAQLGRLLGAEAGLPPGKIRTVYNGVDLDQFRPPENDAARLQVRAECGVAADARVVLFVGNFYEIKNPLALVRAHIELSGRDSGENPLLVMIGGGPLEAEARALADAGGGKGRVLFAGRKTAGEVARWMQAADVLCLPSWNEGVPNVILEAFACGQRVVASDVGGIAEVLTQPFLGRLVPAGDAAALAQALGEELSRPAQARAIRAHALQFSWERAAQEYRAILEEALESRR